MLSIGLVGYKGRVGEFLQLRLHDTSNFRITALIDRAWLNQDHSDTSFDLTLFAVPDDQLQSAAEQFAATNAHTIVAAHFSGACDSSKLSAIDAQLGSIHPIHSFSDPSASARHFDGTPMGIEGEAADMLTDLANDLGGDPFTLTGPKAQYHAATALAANGAVALAAHACALLQGSLDEAAPDARELLLPMMHAVLDRSSQLGFEDALTGPVQRGDVSTVKEHLASLTPQQQILYRALSKSMLDLVPNKTKNHLQIADILD